MQKPLKKDYILRVCCIFFIASVKPYYVIKCKILIKLVVGVGKSNLWAFCFIKE